MIPYICMNEFVNVWVVDITREFGSKRCVWKIVSWVVVVVLNIRKMSLDYVKEVTNVRMYFGLIDEVVSV